MGALPSAQALRYRALRRGFAVRTRLCRSNSLKCDCAGVHFAVAGNGVRRNNLTHHELAAMLEDYPVLGVDDQASPVLAPDDPVYKARAAWYRDR